MLRRAARRRLRALAAQLAAPDGLRLGGCSGDEGEGEGTPLREFVPPVIDLARLGGGPAEVEALAHELDEAFQDVGFCLVTGYDALCPQATLDRLRAEAATYFALPLQAKEASRVDDIFGYVPDGVESVAASIGELAPPDLVEGVNFTGRDHLPDVPSGAAGVALSEAPWLADDWVQAAPAALGEAASDYWCGQLRLLEAMMELASIALGLPLEFFATQGGFGSGAADSSCVLRLAHYVDPPPAGPEEGQARYNAHTDCECQQRSAWAVTVAALTVLR